MPRRLLVANVLLLAVAVGAVVHIVREVTTAPRPMPLRARPVNPEPPTPAPPTTLAIPPGGFAVVASKNLFSPTRTEAPAGATQQQRAAANLPKPTLHGVVMREGAPIAYLEDPMTKRVAGYRLGDAVAGGTVQTIDSDHVVLMRPEGQVDVRLRDPAKPRTAAAPAVQPPPMPATPGGPVPPGVPQPGVTPETGVQPQTPPGQVPPRRMLPPNLLRRVPPTTSDATN